MPRGFGFFNELLRGEAVLAALPEVATDTVDPFPAPPTYGLPLASVIEIEPPVTGRGINNAIVIDARLVKILSTIFSQLIHRYVIYRRN